MFRAKETEIGMLPGDWEVGSFESDVKVQGRIGWKGYKTSDLVERGPLVIGGTEIKSSIFLDLSKVKRLSLEKYMESPEIMLKDGDVLLATRGNLGEVGYYHAHYGEGTINPSVVILNEFRGDSKFLFYYLLSRAGRASVLSLAGGSSVPAIYQADLRKLLYPKPPLVVQEAISETMYSIDLKIDLLHRQNKTLEQLAETLFRKWFVEEAEEGWEITTLGNLFEIKIGRTPPRKEHHWFSKDANNIKWLSIKDMGNSGVYLDEVSEYLTREAVEQFSIPIIPNNTVVLSFKLTVGRVGITTQEMVSNEAIAHFRPRMDRSISPELLYLFLRSFKFAGLGSTSSIAEAVNSKMIKEMEIALPDDSVISSFHATVAPLFSKIRSNTGQMRVLTNLRELLLPTLMTGQTVLSDFANKV